MVVNREEVDTPELAQGYTVLSNTQFDAALFLLERLQIKPGQRVLDVGCGPGNITAHIAKILGDNGSIVGIDPSKERIDLAHQLEKTIANISFHVGIAEDLSRFPTADFDVVFVNSTFHWVQDQPKAMSEFARVLKSGGRLGMSGGSGDFVAEHERIKASIFQKEPFSQYPADEGGPVFVKRKDLSNMLENAGFAHREIVVNTIVKSAKNGAEMVDWLDTSSSGATYGGMPLDLRPMARNLMMEEWAKVTTDDGIKMEMELLVTVAIKA